MLLFLIVSLKEFLLENSCRFGVEIRKADPSQRNACGVFNPPSEVLDLAKEGLGAEGLREAEDARRDGRDRD